jgi:hypothetical protein
MDGTPIAWFHRCPREGIHFVGVGEACNWCGGTEAQEAVPAPARSISI